VAIIYVRSTDGNNADNGSTWALAKATIAGALAIAVGGDIIYVSQAHSESAAGITWTSAATTPDTITIIAANDGAEPPTAEAASLVSITTTGNNSLNIIGPLVIRGFSITIGSGGGARAVLDLSGVFCSVVIDKCDLTFSSSGNNNGINMNTGNSVPQFLMMNNVRIKFSGTSDRIYTNGRTIWRGGSIISGSATPTRIVTSQTEFSGARFYTNALLEDLDLSNLDASVQIFDPNQIILGVIRDCKLPSGWSGTLIRSGSAFTFMERAELYNCDSGDTNYRLWIEDVFGSIKHETTLVKTSGASDGTTPLSWKMASTAYTKFPFPALRSQEIVRWNDTTGSTVTVTIDILHDSATALTNHDIIVEFAYLGTSGFPVGSVSTQLSSDVLSASSNHSASSATWTTTGMSNPNTQKISASFTPQEKGFIVATVCLLKASYTVYVDPVLQSS
jgi:hypothetical protein